MPNKKSAEKELRKSIKRNVANKKQKETVKKLVKTNLKAIVAKDAGIKESLPKTFQAIDKAAKNGVIKKGTAARKKSRLMKKVNSLAK